MIPLTIFSAVVMAVLLYFIHGLDDWLGILAFETRYLVFSVVAAVALAAAWLAKSKKASLVAGLAAFALLVSPMILSEPSSRILREILIEVHAGMPGDAVVAMVEDAYRDSGYVMPRIRKEGHRIHVSLCTQRAGDCTAAVFYLADGRVVKDEFSAD